MNPDPGRDQSGSKPELIAFAIKLNGSDARYLLINRNSQKTPL